VLKHSSSCMYIFFLYNKICFLLACLVNCSPEVTFPIDLVYVCVCVCVCVCACCVCARTKNCVFVPLLFALYNLYTVTPIWKAFGKMVEDLHKKVSDN
jgi:hypothetical protein